MTMGIQAVLDPPIAAGFARETVLAMSWIGAGNFSQGSGLLALGIKRHKAPDDPWRMQTSW
jgi:hypothetical protein